MQLAQCRDALERILREELHPIGCCMGNHRSATYYISIGQPSQQIRNDCPGPTRRRGGSVRLCRYGCDLRVYLHPCNRRGVAVSVAGVVSVSRVSNRLHLIRTSGEPCATEAPHTERAAVQSRTTSQNANLVFVRRSRFPRIESNRIDPYTGACHGCSPPEKSPRPERLTSSRHNAQRRAWPGGRRFHA
jgi:hypothetical protein